MAQNGGDTVTEDENYSEVDLNDDSSASTVCSNGENDQSIPNSISLKKEEVDAMRACSLSSDETNENSRKAPSPNGAKGPPEPQDGPRRIETTDEEFHRLQCGVKNNSIGHKEVSNSIFHILVGGPFDVENNFVIENHEAITRVVDLLDSCQPSLQAEVWSIFIGIIKKSHKNLEACSQVGLISLVLSRLSSSDNVVAELFVELLGVLASYSVDVLEMKKFLMALKRVNGEWPRHSAKLLYVLKQMPKKEGPDIFFSFSGVPMSGIQIPPITKWPTQGGWTFATWLRIDPTSATYFERQVPYIYSFRTSTGLGYSCHLVGQCLVVTALKTKSGKGYQLCVKFELKYRRWHHLLLSHVCGRWGKPSEVQCFVDGQQVATLDMAWQVGTSEPFDRCFIGFTSDEDKRSSFCGQMSAVYVFGESLTMQQAASLHHLGSNYQNSFKFDNEVDTVAEGHAKFIFNGKLADSLVFAYFPKNCDGQLCLESSPKENSNHFRHTPHALMMQGVSVVSTHSIYSSLHSIGGVQMLLPLFSGLDSPQRDESQTVDYTMCHKLLSVIAQLLEASPSIQQQLFQTKAFLIIGEALTKASKNHITDQVLDILLHLAKILPTYALGVPMLKQLFDCILLNPALWIHTEPKLQIRLYNFLSTDFVNCLNFHSNVRRVSTTMLILHALKFYYWVVDPRSVSGIQAGGLDGARPDEQRLVQIRSLMLNFMKKVLLKPPAISPGEQQDDEVDAAPKNSKANPSNKDDELESIFNYLTTVQENENLYDVLKTTVTLLSEDAASMVPAFDRKKGVCLVFKLLSSSSELVRLSALKLLGFFLCRSTSKRKQDCMAPYNLFTLLPDRLLFHMDHISIATYNTIFEILVENLTPSVIFNQTIDFDHRLRLENPMLLKVIADLLIKSRPCDEVTVIKRAFTSDLLKLCTDNRENRRVILQMSVWQEWLLGLSSVYPKTEDEKFVSEAVFRLFCLLLHHAVKLEYGGWRVWVDTLAIVHSKVSFENFQLEHNKMAKIQSQLLSCGHSTDSSTDDSAAVVRSVLSDLVDVICADHRGEGAAAERQCAVAVPSTYRKPELRWSRVHVRMLDDLLTAIEADVAAWKSSSTGLIIEHANDSENAVFVVNTVHVISQLVDNLIMACGGLLPLLAAATSPNSDLEIVDSTQQNLAMDVAIRFLVRFSSLVDIMVFATAVNFSELEQEKNIPSGGILRQCLRLACTLAVCNCLCGKCRLTEHVKNYGLSSKQRAIRCLAYGLLDDKEKQLSTESADQLLQEVDLSRIKAVIYRDVDETRQAQFLALATVYFLSVLMVSGYRDILDPPPSPSPFFASNSEVVRTVSELKEAFPNSHTSSSTNEPMFHSNDENVIAATPNFCKSTQENDREINLEPKSKQEGSISSIQLSQQSPTQNCTAGENVSRADDLPLTPQAPHETSRSSQISKERQATITAKLRAALDSTAPFLRDIFIDFRTFLQKTLLGTHGQEIMNDAKVLNTLVNKQSSTVELVMLLCSQEWQTALQKFGGHAFIELVNEGRLLAHATRDHVVRVANEADFILNRLRAEDVAKHAEFDGLCAQVSNDRKIDDETCRLLINAARRRDALYARRINEKILNILTSKHGAWVELHHKSMHRKLDTWEDDSRRRKRLVPNPAGSSHLEAALKATLENDSQDSELDEAKRSLLVNELPAGKSVASLLPASSAVGQEPSDQAELSKWASDEREVDLEPMSNAVNFTCQARLIAPCLTLPGVLSVSTSELSFDCDEDTAEFNELDPRILHYCDNLHGRWLLNEIRAIFSRRYMQQTTALELFLSTRTAILFAFDNLATVKKVLQHLPRVGVGSKYGLPQSRKVSLMSPRQLFKHSDMPAKWQRREISNFDYLMFLNTIAGRTYNDLNQYPVFPWILSNYESEELDLKQPMNFRDLTKPIGALEESRWKVFDERYRTWEHEKIPPFHYGTHYSTAAFTLSWLVRMEPFTTMFLQLQGGKFDHPDRTFHSLAESWKSCLRDTHDVKELIPELFYLPEMLINENSYNLGKRDDKTVVNDVLLPRWADNPEHFVMIHRQALESDLVSCQLNHWIDLIFGYKQRGPEAVKATNVFYYLTYEGALDLSTVSDSVMKLALENQIKNFGQTPSQLLTEPHAPRQSIMTISPMIFQPITDDLCMVMKFISNSPIVHLTSNTFAQLPCPTVLSITAGLGFALNRWNSNYAGPAVSPTFAIPAPHTTTKEPLVPNLPLTVDPLLATGNPSVPVQKRHMGDAFDQRVPVKWNSFACTIDSKFIFACGYPDYSFRVIETESAHLHQVIYGHKAVVTCLGRSECSVISDFYLATGSADCTVLLWHWSSRSQLVVGDTSPGEMVNPRAVLTGHDSCIACVLVSAEHGMVVSSSGAGSILVHTTNGDLLRSLNGISGHNLNYAHLLAMSRDCYLAACFLDGHLKLFTTSGRLMRAEKMPLQLNCMVMSRDGEYLVVGSDQGRVLVLRCFDLQLLYSYPSCDSSIKSVALSQNHRFILCGLASGALVIFNVDFNKWHYGYKIRYGGKI